MTQPVTLGHDYLRAADLRPDHPAILASGLRISHGQLRDLVVAVAVRMQREGIGPDTTVAVRSDDLVVVLATLMATAILGASCVPDSPAARAAPALAVRVLLHTDPDAPEGLPPGLVARRIDESWATLPADLPRDRPLRLGGAVDPDRPWLIVSTSGTTGTPKFVGLSQRVMAARVAANRGFFTDPEARVLGLFPLTASAQMSRYISALVCGATIVVEADPRLWPDLRPTLVIGSATQLRATLADVVLPRRLPLVAVGGSGLPEDLARHLLRSFERVTNSYASTEVHAVLSDSLSLAEDGSLQMRTTLRPGAAVEVVDARDQPVPVGQEGVVRVRSSAMVSGYLTAPEAAARAFRDGWFYPGDLGRWTAEGRFVVSGRINDQFNLGGVKINAMLLDFALQSVPGVRDAICFLMPREGRAPRLTALISLSPGAAADEALTGARIAALRLGGKDVVPERFLFADRLPRTATGKPDRAGCVALVEAGRAQRRAAMQHGHGADKLSQGL